MGRMMSDEIWDSKRGRVIPRRKMGWNITLKLPQLEDNHVEYRADYNNAKVNQEWHTDPFNPKWDWKEGYSKYGCADTKMSPDTIFESWYKKEIRIYRIQALLKFIPFVNVEVIE